MQKEPLEIMMSVSVVNRLKHLGPPIGRHIEAALASFYAKHKGREALEMAGLSADEAGPRAMNEDPASTSLKWIIPRDLEVKLSLLGGDKQDVIRAALRHYLSRLNVPEPPRRVSQQLIVPEDLCVSIATVVLERLKAIALHRDVPWSKILDEALRKYLTDDCLRQKYPAISSYGDCYSEIDQTISSSGTEVRIKKLPERLHGHDKDRVVRAALRAVVAENSAITAGIDLKPRYYGANTSMSNILPQPQSQQPAARSAPRPRTLAAVSNYKKGA